MADIEKVIKALEECVKYDYSCKKCPYKPKSNDEEKDCSIELTKDALELLKEQQQKTGHWIRNSVVNMFGGVEIVCSVCGNVIIRTDVNAEHFCSNCGAKMGEQP